MRIVQTFWSGNKGNILSNSYGWNDANSHIQSWALSCQLLKRLYSEVELYTDKVGYDLLINKLKLPYKKAHVILDDLNEYPESVWALSKIRTYSLQKTPFIHVDGDVFLWKAFSDELLKAGLIVQNREIGNSYFNASWSTLEEQLNFIPNEISRHRKKEKDVNVYNFGIFGGTDLDFIQEYTKKAFGFVDKNLDSLDAIKGLNFNIFFEQYLFYCMAQDRQVSTYFNRDFVADQYKGLVSFHDVPTVKSYLHLLGEFKQNRQICRDMSRQLSVEFPEQYHTCLNIVDSKDSEVFDLQNNSNTIKHQKFDDISFASYYQSVSFQQKFRKSKEKIQYNSSNTKEELDQKITQLNNAEITQIFQYELAVDDFLKSLSKIDFTSYAQWEYDQAKSYINFIKKPEHYRFKKSSLPKVISSTLIIPSVKEPFYTEVVLDELENAILNESEVFLDLEKLLIVMQEYFDEDDIKTNCTNYKKLIHNSVKRLAYQGALNLTMVEKEILSRGVDTSLECL